MKILDCRALPPIYNQSKELLGIFDGMPVLPCYFEVDPGREHPIPTLDDVRFFMECPPEWC